MSEKREKTYTRKWVCAGKNCGWAVKDTVTGQLMAIASTRKQSVIKFGQITGKNYDSSNSKYYLPKGFTIVKIIIVEAE